MVGSLCILVLFLSALTGRAQPPPSFKCDSKTTCRAMVGYSPATPTTLGAIQSLFQVKTLRTLLGVNNLPLSTPPTSPVPANRTVRVAIPCRCSNGTGLSNRHPIYTVAKDDSLSKIASLYFSGLVTYHQIQAVNGIKDANLIKVGQKLWVPLPCSCDYVEAQPVVHYAHVVAPATSLDAIAAQFGTTTKTLMTVNGVSDPKKLMAGQVLDVPLKACRSSISNSSVDARMVVANGTYGFTANNCVMCKCDSANNFTLQCQASGLKPVDWPTCPATQCPNNLSLGNYTLSSTCSRSTCAYAGYRNQTILTTLVDDNTCSESAMAPSSDEGSKMNGRWSLALALLFSQMLLFPRFL